MNTLKVFFNIVDWKRILYFSFVIFLAKYCFLYGFGFETTLSFLDVTLFTTSCIFFYISIYALNYYFLNKNKKTARSLPIFKIGSYILLLAGLLLGIYLSFKIHRPYFSLLFLFSSISAYIYSKYSIQKSFLSLLIKSFLLPFTILSVWWIDSPVNLTTTEWNLFFKLQFITMIYILLSFLSTLTEEIIISITNINEDNLKKNKTLPILLGRKRAKNVTLTMMIFSAFLILFLAFSFFKIEYLFITILTSTLIPQTYIIYLSIKTSTDKEYKKLLKTMKIFHAFGIIGILSIAYYFKYVVQ